MIYVALLKEDNDVVIRGDRCITSIQDLYRVLVYKDTTQIIITKDFADQYFTPSGLTEFVNNAHSVNPYIDIEVESSLVNFHKRAISTLSKVRSPQEFIFLLQKNPTEVMDIISLLCESYDSAYSETIVANNKVSSLQLANSKLQAEYESLQEHYNVLMNYKNELEAKLRTIVARINYSYDKDLDEDMCFHLQGNKYTKILYIKERTRIHYVDSLVFHLQEMLKTFYGVPARVVAIEPYYAYENSKLYPSLVPHWSLSYKDVYMSDIMMAGFQPSLMNDILQDPSNVEYLIILDRGGYKAPHVDGDNVELLYTMSDLGDNHDNLPMSRIISYEQSTLHIPHIKDYQSLSLEERITKYSSMPIVKSIFELIERR